MDNLAIARVLAEIGDLLEIKGENPFKIRAYRNAAETASHLAERLADLTPPQRLAIPGIGKDLAAKIGTLIETGSIPYHQELLQEFPASILDLLHLQGVGPKTAALLYRELGIRTLDDLEAAITQGRLRGVKGIGEKKAGHRPRLGGAPGRGSRGVGDPCHPCTRLTPLARCSTPSVRGSSTLGSPRRSRQPHRAASDPGPNRPGFRLPGLGDPAERGGSTTWSS